MSNKLGDRLYEEKTPQMRDFLKSIAPHDPTTGVCATCGEQVDEDQFKDALSCKEYTISGMCQKCQDSVFGA